ncbi:NitT/TauT family transport system permease protein [Catenuloplanes nepalensis]|uniref:NitT/TauT family transport system permease protein n=1 Tax=Catenuloplanes nepalensis TaxID=587533 RepID=A0ABT9N665_9ACTN|nr:ABC transporter permease [Catenuloplanes nepalensis]MDP9799183.1 NitT/TauT family transport system permease protein [Catenuloplanes nepalensis]
MTTQAVGRFRRPQVGGVLLPLFAFVLILVAWYGAVRLWDVPTSVVPSPELAIEVIFGSRAEYLIQQSVWTLWEVWLGFFIAIVIGVLLALSLAGSRVLDQAISPILVAFNAIPKIAIGPMLVMWFGFGIEPKVLVVVLLSFFPIVLSTMAGLKSVPADLIELTQSMDASRTKTFLKVRVPWALPQFFTGLKLGISLAFVGAVVGEFIGGGGDGIGYVIASSRSQLNTPLAFAGIFLLGLMSVLSYYVIVWLERLLLPWARETSR